LEASLRYTTRPCLKNKTKQNKSKQTNISKFKQKEYLWEDGIIVFSPWLSLHVSRNPRH
jgi:hypothetical protein